VSRLATEPNIWLTTVRPDGRPHLVPIWFVWVDDRFWVCTTDSVKTRNVEHNAKVAVSLENGNRPLVAEGTAVVRRRPYPPTVARAFVAKFEWDIDRPDADGYDALVEITVDRWLFGGPDA
jgi:hypothetical protein